MEVFAKSLVSMIGLDIDVLDYSALSIKIKEVKIKLPPICKDSGGGYVVSIDSTGLKTMVKENGTVRSAAKKTVGNG